MSHTVTGAYDRAARRYDARWARYTARSLALLRPHLPAASPLLLDVGCGTGALLRHLAGWGMVPARYVGVDLSAEMLAAARARGTPALLRGDVSALPLRSGSVPLVVSASSLHDWPDLPAALAEIRRVLATEGRLLLLDWCADYRSVRLMRRWLRLTRRPVARVLTADALRDELSRSGFRVGSVERRRITPVWGMMVADAVAG
jgi:ubiquinone/menaquinone biosynthesis C-methylase UbiE